MNLFINSPVYYTQYYGVINEVYDMCNDIAKNIDITLYTDKLDTIGITPIVAPNKERQYGRWSEDKRVSLSYRMADISLAIDFDDFYAADTIQKTNLILDNIIQSLMVVKKKLQSNFDFDKMKQDILAIVENKLIS